MSEVSKIEVDGANYDIKDETARDNAKTNADAIAQLNTDIAAIDILGMDGTALAEGDDLNDCLDSEKYYSNSASISRSLSNAPSISTAFSMFVVHLQRNSARLMQIILDGAGNAIYTRGYTPSSTTWTSWKQLSASEATTTSASPSEYSFVEDGKKIEG